jgi:hypothetical protein
MRTCEETSDIELAAEASGGKANRTAAAAAKTYLRIGSSIGISGATRTAANAE